MSIKDMARTRRESDEAVKKFGPWDDWHPQGEECALNLMQETPDALNYAEKWEDNLPDKYQPYVFEIQLYIRQAHAAAMALAEILYETTDADVLAYRRKKERG